VFTAAALKASLAITVLADQLLLRRPRIFGGGEAFARVARQTDGPTQVRRLVLRCRRVVETLWGLARLNPVAAVDVRAGFRLVLVGLLGIAWNGVGLVVVLRPKL
jgi:hypothetical protein